MFLKMADALLQRRFLEKALNQAAMCAQEEALVRPLMSDVVATLSFLLTIPEGLAPAHLDPTPPSLEVAGKSDVSSNDGDSSGDTGDSDHEGSET